MNKNKQYVTRLMYAKCDKGSMDNRLNLPDDHGVIFGDAAYPLMNASDYEPNKNLIHFGRCRSLYNPDYYRDAITTVALSGLLNPVIGVVNLVSRYKNDSEGCKCRPKTVTPWVKTNKKSLLDGAPALLLESTATCFWGGVITIVERDITAEAGENEEENDDVKEPRNPVELLPEHMQAKITEFCGEPDVTTSPEAESGLMKNALEFLAGLNNKLIASSIIKMSKAIDMIDLGCAGIPDVNFSQEMSIQNLIHNRGQSISPDALDANGNIINAQLLNNFNIGNTSLAAVDIGGVAVYNALNKKGQNPDLSEIIFHREQYALGNSQPIGGCMAASLNSMRDYLIKKEIETQVVVAQEAALTSIFEMPEGKIIGTVEGTIPFFTFVEAAE